VEPAVEEEGEIKEHCRKEKVPKDSRTLLALHWSSSPLPYAMMLENLPRPTRSPSRRIAQLCSG